MLKRNYTCTCSQCGEQFVGHKREVVCDKCNLYLKLAHDKPTPIVTILQGVHEGENAYVTWNDGEFIRVTPLEGDPLDSIELKMNVGEFVPTYE